MDIEQAITRGLQLAIKAAGNRSKLGDIAGCSRQAAMKWKRIPPERARTISAALRIPLSVLRPDLWPTRRTKHGKGGKGKEAGEADTRLGS